MGSAVAPSYATLYMEDIDLKIKKLARDINITDDPIKLFKRFLDDIFLIWRGSIEKLQIFLEEINNLHV